MSQPEIPMPVNSDTSPSVPRLDDETEHVIEEYAAACYEVGFQDAEQGADDRDRRERESWEEILRSRIRTLIEEAGRQTIVEKIDLPILDDDYDR